VITKQLLILTSDYIKRLLFIFRFFWFVIFRGSCWTCTSWPPSGRASPVARPDWTSSASGRSSSSTSHTSSSSSTPPGTWSSTVSSAPSSGPNVWRQQDQLPTSFAWPNVIYERNIQLLSTNRTLFLNSNLWKKHSTVV